jgi:cytochrome c-type biogenesis protein CcmF
MHAWSIMVAEIGQFWLIATMVLSVVGVISTSYGIVKGNISWQMSILPLSLLSCIFCLLSIPALGYGFYIDDFSIRYIAEHSNSDLPVFFKVAAIWGGHEGSLLFWVLTRSMKVFIFSTPQSLLMYLLVYAFPWLGI